MITLTGAKYSGTVSSYSNETRIIALNDVTLLASDFNTSRFIALFSSNGNFKAIAYIREFISATELRTEYGFFNVITNLEVTPETGDFFDISFVPEEIETTDFAVTNDRVTITNEVVLGTAGNERSLCLYFENKNILVNASGTPNTTGQISGAGGVVVLGHLLSNTTLNKNNTCSLTYTGASTNVAYQTKDIASHFIYYGGSIKSEGTPSWFGGFRGSAGGTLLLDEVKITNTDLLSVGAGGSWGQNEDRHILRRCSVYARKNNGILVRWGNGSIEGGSYQLAGSEGLGVFGTDSAGNYTISANPNERLIIAETGFGEKPQFFRSSSAVSITLNGNNIITPNRNFKRGTAGATPNENATGIFTYTDTYRNSITGTKVIINDSNGNLVDSGISTGTDIPLTIEEARVVGFTETVTESNWSWGAYIYGKNFMSGTFSTNTVTVIGGEAKDVKHGANLLQENDNLISSTKTVSSNLPISISFDETAFSVSGTSNEIPTITTLQLYDAICLYMEVNFTGVDIRPNRVDSLLDFESLDVNLNLDMVLIDGTIKLNSTKTVNLSNGSKILGGTIDSSGDSFLTFTGVTGSVQVYDVPRNSDYTFNNSSLADLQPNEIYRFIFSSQTFYAMVDGVYIGAITPLEAGETIVNRTTAGILATLDTKVNEVPTKVWEDETEYTGEQKGNVLKDARKCARLSLQRTS